MGKGSGTGMGAEVGMMDGGMAKGGGNVPYGVKRAGQITSIKKGIVGGRAKQWDAKMAKIAQGGGQMHQGGVKRAGQIKSIRRGVVAKRAKFWEKHGRLILPKGFKPGKGYTSG